MFFANSNSDLRARGVLQSALDTDTSYLPMFTTYAEYDFRNAQAIELMEESFWENSYSSYNHADYLDIKTKFSKPTTLRPRAVRLTVPYYEENTEEVDNTEDVLNPTIKDLSLVGQFYANVVQSDEPLSYLMYLYSKDLSVFPLIEDGLSIDDSYINAKGHYLYVNTNNSYTLNSASGSLYPQSYVSVFDNFRANFDEFSTHAGLSTELNTNDDLNLETEDDLINHGGVDVRFTNPATLRTTARNSIVTYSAVQKVFRTRFEDGRANTKVSHFSNLKPKQPFINEARAPYEKMLGKNRTNYYNNTFYSTSTMQSFNQFSTLANSLNT